MKEGLYRIHFAARAQIVGMGQPMGSGVVYLRNGIAAGGDDAFYYSGHYVLDETRITVDATVKRHTNSPTSSIFGTDTNVVKLNGTADIDGQIRAFGETSQGIKFEVNLHWLAD